MADQYIGPVAAGTGDGSSWANQRAFTGLNTAIGLISGGEFVYVAVDQGPYTVTGTVNITNAGAAGAIKTIIGVNSALSPVDPSSAPITGNRTAWTLPVTKTPINASTFGGNTLINFQVSTVAFLTFKNLYFLRVGTCFNMSSVSCNDLTFEDITIYNCRTGFYNTNTSGCFNIRLIRTTGIGFSKEYNRMRGTSRDYYIEDPQWNSGWQDGDAFARGMYRDEFAGAVTMAGGVTRAGFIKNIIQTTNGATPVGFRNGDGMSEEHNCTNLTVTNITITDCSDAAIDSKGRYQLYTGVAAVNCGWPFKLYFSWGFPYGRMVNCSSTDPIRPTGDSFVCHLWGFGRSSDVGGNSSTWEIVNFSGTGGPTGMRAFIIENSVMTWLFNNDGGVVLPSGGVLQQVAAGSQILYNQPIGGDTDAGITRRLATPSAAVVDPAAVNLASAGLQVGDYAVVWCGYNAADFITGASPAGWTQTNYSGTSSTNILLWRKFITSGDLAAPITFATGHSFAPFVIQGYINVDTVTPLDIAIVNTPDAAADSAIDIPSFTPATNGAMAVLCGGMRTVNTTMTFPSGFGNSAYIGYDGTGSKGTNGMCDLVIDPAAATDPGDITWASGTFGKRALTIVLRPAATVSTSAGSVALELNLDGRGGALVPSSSQIALTLAMNGVAGNVTTPTSNGSIDLGLTMTGVGTSIIVPTDTLERRSVTVPQYATRRRQPRIIT